MIKIIAFVCIVYAFSSLGHVFSNEGAQKIVNLEELKRAFYILKSEIKYSSNNLLNSLENIVKFTEKPVSTIFENIIFEMSKKEKSIMEICVAEFRCQETLFSNAVIERLCSFGQTLGLSDAEMQISNIDQMILYFDEELEKLKILQEKNSKLYKSLGLLTGLIVAVVLI